MERAEHHNHLGGISLVVERELLQFAVCRAASLGPSAGIRRLFHPPLLDEASKLEEKLGAFPRPSLPAGRSDVLCQQRALALCLTSVPLIPSRKGFAFNFLLSSFHLPALSLRCVPHPGVKRGCRAACRVWVLAVHVGGLLQRRDVGCVEPRPFVAPFRHPSSSLLVSSSACIVLPVLVWLKWAKIKLEVGGWWMQVLQGGPFRRTVLVGAQGCVCIPSRCRADGAE